MKRCLSIICLLGCTVWSGPVLHGQDNSVEALISKATLADPAAQFQLSIRLGGAYAEASDIWLKLSANNGHEPAMMRMAENLLIENRDGLSDTVKREILFWYRQAADKEYIPAQRVLGYLYSSGEIVPQNQLQAASWFTKAAWQGDKISQFNVGKMYLNGQGVSKDTKQAVTWLLKAAEQEYVPAQALLGVLYFSGEHVEQDFKAAATWFGKAAQRGDAHSQYSYGILLYQGKGVERNLEESARWITAAANQGYGPGQLALGERYITGAGMQVNILEAYKWLELAVRSGISQAKDLRDRVDAAMTPQQKEQAVKLVNEWQPSIAAAQ